MYALLAVIERQEIDHSHDFQFPSSDPMMGIEGSGSGDSAMPASITFPGELLAMLGPLTVSNVLVMNAQQFFSSSK